MRTPSSHTDLPNVPPSDDSPRIRHWRERIAQEERNIAELEGAARKYMSPKNPHARSLRTEADQAKSRLATARRRLRDAQEVAAR